MRCEKCNGKLTVQETVADIYITYRKRRCEKCGRVIYTEEDQGDYAEYFFKEIKKERQALKEREVRKE